jgi:pimeloyl-ACP methyl ester carboxylesterase
MATSRTTSTRRGLCRACTAITLIALSGLSATTNASVPNPAAPTATAPDFDRSITKESVREWTIEYKSHTGAMRAASIVLPAWYGPDNNPVLPVVISPHGRAGTGHSNAKYFGNMPAVGRFALISPDGMGRRLKNFSYGAPGQIDDLAKMPDFAKRALPWLRLDRTRVYAIGSSMGGQETLLLVARHPRLLAGAAALDSVTDLTRRYHQMTQLPCPSRCLQKWGKPYGAVLQSTLGREVGGSPAEKPDGYAARSGMSQASKLAFAQVPLQIWWSADDVIVFDQEHQSKALFDKLRRLNPCASVSAYAGTWAHSREMRPDALLPIALKGFGLLTSRVQPLPASVDHTAAAPCSAAKDTV